MKSQRTNSTFANSNTQADASVCKRAIFLQSHNPQMKRTESKKKQPSQSSNFCPFCTMTTWTWRKCIRIIIKPDYFSTFYAFVATFSWFFSCSVHKNKFKRLITRSINCYRLVNTKTIFETLLRTLFGWTNFNCFFYSCGWSSCSFSVWHESTCSCISYSSRCFTHDIKIKNSTIYMGNRDKPIEKKCHELAYLILNGDI